jgi:hypothetical protein
MIKKLPDGRYRLYSLRIDARTGRRRNLGTFSTRKAAEQHEREIQFFKRRPLTAPSHSPRRAPRKER